MTSDLMIVAKEVTFGNSFLSHRAAVHSLFPRFTALFFAKHACLVKSLVVA